MKSKVIKLSGKEREVIATSLFKQKKDLNSLLSGSYAKEKPKILRWLAYVEECYQKVIKE